MKVPLGDLFSKLMEHADRCSLAATVDNYYDVNEILNDRKSAILNIICIKVNHYRVVCKQRLLEILQKKMHTLVFVTSRLQNMITDRRAN